MNIPVALKNLATLFPVPLYVVGGAVRDYLLGYKLSDYDLASSLTCEEVMGLLKDTKYKATPHSLKLGTLGVKVDGLTVEYTAFRKDSYSLKGNHLPERVEFNCDIKEDALRRDFTVNALYYDIKNDEIVDLVGGVEDVKNGVIRAVREPKEVIKEDALRILRMVRFSAKLGFKVEENTLRVAKEEVSSLQEIAPERIREEFNKILVADTENGIKDAQIRGLELLIKIGAMQYVVPEILEGIGVKQPPRHHAYDVFGHTMHAVEAAPPHLRLAAFLHDVGKPRAIDEEGRMTEHPLVGAHLTKVIMNRLLYPRQEIEKTVRLVKHHMFDIKCLQDECTVREFILENFDILDDLIALKKADHVAHGKKSGVSPSAVRLSDVREEMLKNKVAFTLKELPVGGKTLIDLGVPPKERGEVLRALLEYGAFIGRALSVEECVSYVKSCIN